MNDRPETDDELRARVLPALQARKSFVCYNAAATAIGLGLETYASFVGLERRRIPVDDSAMKAAYEAAAAGPYYYQFNHELTPADERLSNYAMVANILSFPPSRVLSRGQKQGATYERWTRALAGLLEQCNARAEPLPITQAALLACEEEALRE